MRLLLNLLLVSVIFAQNYSDTLTLQLQKVFNNFTIAGMSVIVVKKDSIVYKNHFGKRDIANNLSINDNTIYRIASISKSFVSTAIMQLVEQGKLSLKSDVSSILGFQVRNPNFPNDTITIEMLLTHTSSLSDNAGYSTIDVLNPNSSSYNPSLYLNKKPGTYFTYCNLAYSTLGCIVEKIANKRFDIYVKENILNPLGMNASYNIDDFTQTDFQNIAVLYRYQNNQWIAQKDNYNGVKPSPQNLSNYVIGKDAFIFSPTGGLRTSALDLAKFMIAHMNGGVYKGKKILNTTSVQQMHSVKWAYNGSNGDDLAAFFYKYGYAFHWPKELIKGQNLCGVPGEAYGLLSDMYFSPDSLYGIVFITNGGVFNYAANDFYDIEDQVINTVFKYFLYPQKKTPLNKTLNETFDSFPPEGWAITNLSGQPANSWLSYTTAKPSGSSSTSKVARINYTASGILITKQVSIKDTNNILSFNFRKFCGNKYSSKFDVMVSENSNQLDITKYNVVKTFLRDDQRGQYINDNTPVQWESASINLSNFINKDVFIAFKIDNTYDDGGGAALAGDTWDIDDVVLTKTTATEGNNKFIRNFDVKLYPNPANPNTNLLVSLPFASDIEIKIFNITGQIIYANKYYNLPKGNSNIKLNFSNINSGIYLINITAGNYNLKEKFILIK